MSRMSERKHDLYRGAAWQYTRQAIVRRDGGACTKCGSTRNLTVHHKTKGAGFYEPSNLVTLCRPCHDGIHNSAPKQRPQRPRGEHAKTLDRLVLGGMKRA